MGTAFDKAHIATQVKYLQSSKTADSVVLEPCCFVARKRTEIASFSAIVDRTYFLKFIGMTEENYNYRTNQTLLRNQFSGKGKLKIPIIPKFNSKPDDFLDLLRVPQPLVRGVLGVEGHPGNPNSELGGRKHL